MRRVGSLAAARAVRRLIRRHNRQLLVSQSSTKVPHSFRSYSDGIHNCNFLRLSLYSLSSYSTVAGASHGNASSVQTEEPQHLRTGLVGEALSAYLAVELALDSVVKIFTVTSSPNHHLPWQNKSQRETMGSGLVISGKRILTIAHVVADHTFVLVRKHGSPTKYRAEVQAVGHDCDLDILVVENEDFWEG